MLKIFKENSDPKVLKEKSKDSLPRFATEGNKIHFISLASRNLVDSEVMLGILLRAGYEVAQQLEDADYLVINTCGFLEASRKESMDTVNDSGSPKERRQVDCYRLYGSNS